jgi:hypothetical protein
MKALNYQCITYNIVHHQEDLRSESLDQLLQQRDFHVSKALSIAHGKPPPYHKRDNAISLHNGWREIFRFSK